MKLYWFTLIAYGLFTSQFVYADDTEIYRNTQNRVNPNVVFLIDTSGSMAYRSSSDNRPNSGESSRLDIVKTAAKNAIDKLDPSLPINIAVMRFDERYSASTSSNGGAKGGYVLYPFTATSSATNKQLLKSSIDSMTLGTIGGGTPITESVFEAYRYLTGKTAEHGAVSEATTNCSGSQTSGCLKAIGTQETGSLTYFSRNVKRIGSHASSLNSDGTYKSPVTATCQKNHIVLFTDGAASSDVAENSNIQNLIKNMTMPSGYSKNCSGDGGCAVQFAYWLQETDHFTDEKITGKTGDEIKQSIYVHTVGGFSGITTSAATLLKDMAKYGHPQTSEHLINGESKHYYKADDEDALTAALVKVFGGIANTAGNFAAPVVAVNAFNSLEHRDELYYSVFQPAELPGWSGNIKRYRMDSSGNILDKDDVAAIDPKSGFFKDTAWSFWTENQADGPIVTRGGIANRMPATRAVYTRLSGFGDIVSTANRVHEDNTSIKTDMLDDFLPVGSTMTSTERSDALKWARGIDPKTGQPHYTLPDPLHGNPVLMTYRTSASSTADVLFTGTNAGYIHAFNPDRNAPGELWAFVPKEMLPNLAVYQQGLSRFVKAYGIDGPLSIYHDDKNNDRIIDAGETAYLAAGMRRGGSHYYLLDISLKDQPKLVAQISSGSSGFEELGQTWSKMIPATVMWNGKKTPVFFFGGGYDSDEDKATTRITHDKGNAIYMVKATSDASGKAFDLLWKATGKSGNLMGPVLSDMKSSFAGDLTLVDNDGNGTVDLIYAADVGGRIWRFDIDKENTNANNFATGAAIADFNDGTEAGNIRFYTQPDVVYTEYGRFQYQDAANPTNIISKSIGRYQIAIGSGFRAGPLSTKVKDKVFVLNDFNIDGAPTSYGTIKLSDLADHNNFDQATYAQQMTGFYFPLPYTGEKVLSTTLTVNDTIYVPTFRPSDSSVEVGCEPDTGQARLIMIKPKTGTLTTERSIDIKELEQGGIVPKPILVFPPSDPTTKEPSKPVIAIGTEINQIDGDFNAFQQTYWREN